MYGLCWCPKYLNFKNEIDDKIDKGLKGLTVYKAPEGVELDKPTMFRLNEFTTVFQLIVDTYDTP